MRTVEYFDFDTNEWYDIEWANLVSGTQIRINEESGDPVLDGTGVYAVQTASDSYKITTISGENEVWAVDTYDPAPYTTIKTE